MAHNRKRAREANRGLPTDSKRWRQMRAIVLADQPLCATCAKLGRVVAATEVDHIDNDSHNNDRSNLQGLCKTCHSVKTGRERHGLPDRRVVSVTGEPDGW